MAKPTKDEIERSEELARMRRWMESNGVKPKDPKHPLAEYPPAHLKKSIILMTNASNLKSYDEFVSVMFGFGGYKVEPRSVRGWFRNSAKITDVQLARILDLMSLYLCDTPNEKCDLYFDCFESDALAKDQAYELAFDCVFGLGRFDIAEVMRLAICASLETMGERELRVLCGVVSLRDSGLEPSICGELANGAPSLERFEALVGRLCEVEISDHKSWAQRTAEMLEAVERKKDDPFPF